MSIDWSNPKSKISKYFTVGEATYLPRLKMYHNPSEDEKENIVKLALKVDKAREIIGLPFTVTIWIRPIVWDGSKFVDYNELVGGAKASEHKLGNAVELVVKGMSAEDVRKKLKDKLPELGLRMEDGVAWCHFDQKPVAPGGNYIFKP